MHGQVLVPKFRHACIQNKYDRLALSSTAINIWWSFLLEIVWIPEEYYLVCRIQLSISQQVSFTPESLFSQMNDFGGDPAGFAVYLKEINPNGSKKGLLKSWSWASSVSSRTGAASKGWWGVCFACKAWFESPECLCSQERHTFFRRIFLSKKLHGKWSEILFLTWGFVVVLTLGMWI